MCVKCETAAILREGFGHSKKYSIGKHVAPLSHTYEERGAQKHLFSLALAFKRQADTQWLNTLHSLQRNSVWFHTCWQSNVLICWLEKKKSHTRAKTRRPKGSKRECLRWDSRVLEWKQPESREKGEKSEETGLNQRSKNMITLRRAWGDEWKQRPLGRGGETKLANREKEENSIPEKHTNITGKQNCKGY